VVATAIYFVLDAALVLDGVFNVLGYAVFLAVGALTALAVAAIARRWDWYLPIALGAILLPLALRLIDDATGLAISGALGSLIWSIVYGLLAAVGALLGLMLMANRRTARRTRL
jgi:hypothetical protein